MDSLAPVTHAAMLVIVARTMLIVDVTRAVIPWVVMEGTLEDITMIVAKEIVTLTIVKVTEVRAKELRAKEVRATKKTSIYVAAKKVTSIVFDSQIMATTIGATPVQQAPAIGYHLRDQFNHANSSSVDDQFDRTASAIVAAYHVDNKFRLQTVVVDSGSTRNMF
jgi:hypothetical protein